MGKETRKLIIMMDIDKYNERVDIAYAKYYDRLLDTDGLSQMIEEQNHVKNVAKSIMLHRDEVMHGGGFVQAIMNNDLESCLYRADDVVIKYLKFFMNVKLYVHLNN